MYVLWGDVEYWDMFMQCYVSVQVRRGWSSLLFMILLRVKAGDRSPDCLLDLVRLS